jgi:uncharacterized protein YbjT (DUF2867 family)
MILITGASGNVGSHVVSALQKRSVPYRTAVFSSAAPASGQARPAHEQVRLDFQDPSTYAPAVKGCNAVFLMRPPAIADTKHTLNVFIDVARAAGVRQIVFVSVAGARHNPLVPHHAVEMHLRQGPGAWTILQPGFFAQNLGDAYRQDIQVDQRLYVPAGNARVAFLDTRDLADAAALALCDPSSHNQKSYHLTGPESLSFADVAQLLSDVLGRPIHYESASVLDYAKHLHSRQLPWAQVAVQTLLHVGLRFGQGQVVDPELERLLGRPARRMAGYVRDDRQLWA